MCEADVSVRDIYLARRRIRPLLRPTPLLHSAPLSAHAGCPVWLKLENLQETGSFKLRGAANLLLSLDERERARGVIAVSSGNHGRAVAYVAARLGVRAVVCLSEQVPPNKVQAIAGLGAEVVVHGASYDEAEAHALRLERERGLTPVPPFDHPAIVAGQGTLALELLEELPELETVVVPLSGGGLLGGIGLALKAAHPGAAVVGVSMERAPVMVASLLAGRPVELPEEETLADGLAGGIGLANRTTFRLVQRVLDRSVLVSEDEIAAAMVFMLAAHHQVVEGAGAVGIAALLGGQAAPLRGPVAVVVSGGNVEVQRLAQLALQTCPET